MQAIEVRRDVQDRYNAEIQEAVTGKVWLANCNNYYRRPSGEVVTQLPCGAREFAVGQPHSIWPTISFASQPR
jgi:cyclohexanone monooxygenase